MIQNISAIRFANNIFESQWNNRYIDNVQITFAESLGVEDRGGYYDHSGALKRYGSKSYFTSRCIAFYGASCCFF